MNRQERIDLAWLRTALVFGKSLSKDPEDKNGAVLVTSDNMQCSLGYNGFPIGVDDAEYVWADKELKNALVVHAEMNAVIHAPFNPSGCTLYVTRKPCHTCLGVAKNAGCSRIVYFVGLEWKYINTQAWNEIANSEPKMQLSLYDKDICTIEIISAFILTDGGEDAVR